MDPFFLVWNPNGFPPNFKHETMESAKEEAKRLSNQVPGDQFFVLEAVGFVSQKAVTTAAWTEAINLPF